MSKFTSHITNIVNQAYIEDMRFMHDLDLIMSQIDQTLLNVHSA